MEFTNLLLKRRSIRKYAKETIGEDTLHQILQAGLLAFSGRNIKPWEFIVVKDKDVLKKLSLSRKAGAGMLTDAACAIVVFADTTKTDVWVEDCSISMTFMHLMASELGVGSCWIQGRNRDAADGRSTEAYVRELLKVPEQYGLAAILSLGIPQNPEQPRTLDDLQFDKIHKEVF